MISDLKEAKSLIKEAQKILEKLSRKNIPFTIDDILHSELFHSNGMIDDAIREVRKTD